MEGVSTRRVDDLIKALGCDGISSSQVSRICEQLDEVVESFLGRPLDGGPYPYVWLDGLTQKVREGGRIVNVCVVVATGVKGGEKTCHWGVVGQGKCLGKCSAKMSLRYAAMVSDVDGLGTIRCFHPGGPPASR